MSKASKQIKDGLISHRKWKDRAKAAIETGKSEYTVDFVRRDDTGELGKWLYQTISPEDKASPHYLPVKEIHAKFHIELAKVFDLALKGQKEKATRALGLGSDFARVSMEFDSALIAWYIECVETESAHEDSQDQSKQKGILEARARALTKVAETQTGETMSLVVFSLANETYGVAADCVREIQPLGEVTPVPCTPEFVVGLVNVRGSIYSVIDIRSFFGVPKKQITNSTKVLLAKSGGLEVGILADDVAEAKSLPLSDIKPPILGQEISKDGYVYGVTKDMLTVLNLDTLLRDERIIVRDAVA